MLKRMRNHVQGFTIENFGTFSFHMDYIDLGNQKKIQRR